MSTTFTVNSTNTRYTSEHIEAVYGYSNTLVSTNEETGARIVTPVTRNYTFRTQRRVPKTGVMIVGLGGNNGTTVTAGVLANRDGVSWRDKTGVHTPNYFGSLTQCSTVRLGLDTEGNDVHIPFKDILPMVEMNDLVVGGWDISRMNLADAMERAQVISYDLQRQLAPMMREMVPLPSIYSHDFIAANQEDRADNVIPGTPQEQVDTLRRHMREFKAANNLETVIILWSATTERFAEVQAGVNDTADNLLAAIKRGQVDEISPSTMFAVAAILEGNTYINGSPQNTFVPGLTQLAQLHRVHIAGDDFKTGQTKIKSVLVDFLVSAGIKPRSIVSYNHLGNNDGKNLSSAKQFRSKEISKSNVVDDMVHSNKILYEEGEHPDHVVVIKYVPYVGDSKRAMDEYTSEIFLGGTNTIVLHNTCEDSLLAAPLILDLVVIAELMTRIQYKTEEMQDFEPFHSVLSILAYLLKAPVVPKETPVINALFKQRAALENIFRACLGLPVESNMLLEQKTAGVMKWRAPAAAAQEGARVVA